MNLRKFFLKQYNLGPLVGGLKDVLGRVTFYLSALNFLMIIGMSYNTTFGGILEQWFPWMNFFIFFGVMIVLVLIAIVIEYKFIVPSSFSFQNSQFYEHDNPLRTDIAEVLKEVQKLREEVRR